MNELKEALVSYLDDNNDLFVEVCKGLTSWNSFLSENELYSMYELNDFFYDVKPTDLLNKLDKSFSVDDEYFYFDCWGEICSTSECEYEYYSNLTTSGELINELLENWGKIQLSDDDFNSMVEEYLEKAYQTDIE